MSKSGIPYFPLDVEVDEKLELIEAEYGLTGFAVIVKLLQRIYGGHGYYTEWTYEVALLFAKKLGLGGSVVSEIIQASIRRGMFHQEIFEKYHVLTSAGIQKRYFNAVARRKEIKVNDDILLVNVTQICKNVYIFHENVYRNGKNVNISAQRKEKERREKESNTPLPPKGEDVDFQGVVDMFHRLCPTMPKVQAITEGRKRAIKARFNNQNTLEDFESVFRAAGKSNFLSGKNGAWNGCSFDWLLKPANWQKVKEGNYDDRPSEKKYKDFDWDEF